METQVKEKKAKPVIPDTVWLTEDEAAVYIRRSRETLARARRAGLITPPMLDGKSYGYTREMLDQYIANVANKTVN